MRLRLTAGLLLMIAATETHQIRNTGGQPLVTLKLAAPPLY
jgi:mannose-6-phosphate isomerase-like protein (cupin superfamily)